MKNELNIMLLKVRTHYYHVTFHSVIAFIIYQSVFKDFW